MLKTYTYKNCDSCRKALKFLRINEIAFEEIAIRETPPSKDELRAMLDAYKREFRKLFNTSGGDYKALGLSAKLSSMSESEMINLLALNGNLVKRPFLISKDIQLVGFNEEHWRAAFALN